MKNTTTKNTEKTVSWLKRVTDACPHGNYARFRADIIYRCGWNSRTTYTNKIHGHTELTLPEYAVIKSLCKTYNVPTFDAHAEIHQAV